MTKNSKRLKYLIFEEIDKSDLYKVPFRIAETSLYCYTNSVSLKNHVKSFFYSLPYPLQSNNRESLSLYFLAFNNKSEFIKRLLKDLKSEWTPVYREESNFKYNFEAFQAKNNPNLLLFGFIEATYLIGIVDLSSHEGFYLMPERCSKEFSLDSSVFYFILSELFWSRKYLLIHASCVSDGNGNGILIAGKSGIGKTTFCLRLVEEGYNFLSNDLVLLRQRNNHVEAFGIPEKRIKVRQTPASLFSNIRIQDKGWDEKKRGYIPVDRFYSGNRKLSCRVKILGIANFRNGSASIKTSSQQLIAVDYINLVSAINLFIPRKKTAIDNKLSLISRLFNTANCFRFSLPRDRHRLKRALNRNIEEIAALRKK